MSWLRNWQIDVFQTSILTEANYKAKLMYLSAINNVNLMNKINDHHLLALYKFVSFGLLHILDPSHNSILRDLSPVFSFFISSSNSSAHLDLGLPFALVVNVLAQFSFVLSKSQF